VPQILARLNKKMANNPKNCPPGPSYIAGVGARRAHCDATLGRFFLVQMLFLKVWALRAASDHSLVQSWAKALKLSFAVVRIGERRPNPDWHFMSIAEGRNCYRTMIEGAVAEVLARKVARCRIEN
jgi:hypothetical protein